MRRLILLVPFLLALASLLQLNLIASIYVSPDQLVRPLAVLWLLLALLIWPAYWITRDWSWTALLLSLVVIGFSFSPAFFSTFILSVLLGGVVWLAFARLRRLPLKSYHLLGIMAAAGALYTGYALYFLGVELSHIDWKNYREEVSEARHYSVQALAMPADPPDIYYIILDEYARSDILQEVFQFDNQEFINYLQNKGFIVPASNQSNYPATPVSVASTLNMDYIQTLVPSLNRNPERWLMAPLIDYSRVRAVLEAEGYKTVSLSSNFTITENDTTDVYLHPDPVMLSDFEGYLLSATPLKLFEPLLGKLTSHPTAETYREVILYDFHTLSNLPKIAGPKFVFVHIVSPHPPFAFDKDGNPINVKYPFTYSTAGESTDSFKRKYIGQVQFVNHNMEEAIEAILAESKIPPIILIQADHGSGLLRNLDSPGMSCVHERFSPFAAYYLPGVYKTTFPTDISNVNIFRLVLNDYFQAGLPLLENRQFFNGSKEDYYVFKDVTGRLEDSCSLPNE